MTQIQSNYSIPRIIAHALLRNKARIEDFKPSCIEIKGYYCDSKKLSGFEQAFRHPDDMPTFAFIATFRLVMQCISQSNIPSKLMGLIHLHSGFDINRKQNWLAPTDITVCLENAEQTEKGKLYTVVTTLKQSGEITLVNTNTFLDKARGYKPKANTDEAVEKQESIELGKPIAQLALSLKTAWQYARLSGDFNPIHLHPWLAKKFGLKDVLIHGMFNAHYAVNEVLKLSQELPKHLLVSFNKPCFLPNQAYLRQYGDTNKYGLFSIDGNDRFIKLTMNDTE